MRLWNTGMAVFPCVRIRKVTATRSWKGLWVRYSCTRPNEMAESEGMGRADIVPRGGRKGSCLGLTFATAPRFSLFLLGIEVLKYGDVAASLDACLLEERSERVRRRHRWPRGRW